MTNRVGLHFILSDLAGHTSSTYRSFNETILAHHVPIHARLLGI